MSEQLLAPPVLDDGWQTSSPAQRNLKASVLQKLRPKLQAWPGCNVHAVVIARGRHLVFEEYFTGEDWAWDRPLGQVKFGPDTLHDLRNMTSAAISLMVGNSVCRGEFVSLQEQIVAHLRMPQQFSASIKELTVGNVLNMATGHTEAAVTPQSDPLNIGGSEYISVADREGLIFGQPQPFKPGTYVRNDYMMAALMQFMANTYKNDFQNFMKDEFFDCLETKQFEWTELGINRLRMRPRDVLKLGQLILNKGRWIEGGTTLPPLDPAVSPEWFAEYDTPTATDVNDVQYAYQWRFGRSMVNSESVEWLASFGDGGQRLFVVPSKQLAVLVLAGIYDHSGRAHDLGQSVLEEFALTACE